MTPNKSTKDTTKKWIGVDLDGTLAYYTQHRGTHVIGPPVGKMLRRVRKWLAEGKEVRIVTARVAPSPLRDAGEARAAIERWLDEWLGERIPIQHFKDMHMVELWDDRAVQVIPNTGERADGKAD